MYTLNSYLPEHEARAERTYRQAYCAEYLRLHDPQHASNRERLLYWSELAHRAGKAARERVLNGMSTSPTTEAAALPVSTTDQLRLELGG